MIRTILLVSIFVFGCGTDLQHRAPYEEIPWHLKWQPDESQIETALAYYEDLDLVDQWIESTRVCIRACFEDGGVDFFIWAPPETCNCVRQAEQ